MEDRNKRSNPKADHVKNPIDATTAPTDPFRAPMRGDVNMPSPTTQTEEASAKPYEGQMREHERHENPTPYGEPTPPTRSDDRTTSPAESFRDSPKQGMPGDDFNDPIEPTNLDVEIPPPTKPGESGEYAPKGGSKAIDTRNADGSPRE